MHVRPRVVALRFSNAVFVMRLRKTQALVGQHQNDEQQCEKPTIHGRTHDVDLEVNLNGLTLQY